MIQKGFDQIGKADVDEAIQKLDSALTAVEKR
jgi:hypothetical protein